LVKQKGSGIELIMDQGTKMVLYYREHPCVAAYDLLGADLAPIQRPMFRDMWFKNYVISVCSRGAGKTFLLGTLSALSCMLYPGYRVGLISPVFRQSFAVISDTYDTFWTSGGLQTTAQSFYDSIEEGVTKTQSLESQNIILSKWKNPERSCRSIKTTKGFEFAGTVDHGILILNNELDLVFKDLQDITEEDNITIKKGFKYFGNDNSIPTFNEFKIDWRTKDCKIPRELTPDLAYWMGLLVGDGYLESKTYRFGFVNVDKELVGYFDEYLFTYFGLHSNISGIASRVTSKNVYNFLLRCGLTNTTAVDKGIPKVIKKSSKKCISAFLSGLMDSDGCCSVIKDKVVYETCSVRFSTSSKKLAKEVQALFLNLGIVSNFRIKHKACKMFICGNKNPSNCAEAYELYFRGIDQLKIFEKCIGFRCIRKKDALSGYTNKLGCKKTNTQIVPNSLFFVKNLLHNIKTSNRGLYKNIRCRNKSSSNGVTKEWIKKVLVLAEKHSILTEDYYKLKKIIDLDLSFVKMMNSKYFFAPTIDVEVENESCYWSNGFISHNSKMIFSEVEKLYSQSSVFREACEKRPIRGTDTCYVKFKAVGGMPPAFIEALPLSDGTKIRGSRFYLVCLDELAQIPNQVLDLVIRPMGAATLNPMENVHRLEKQRKLIELGLASIEDFDGEETINKMIMTSSGYYKFNHMWKRMKDHWSMIDRDGDASQYAVWQIPYWDLPEGFLDSNNIAEAKRIMSSSEFKMEYEAEMISDSEGFFKASLLEECTNDSGFSIELKGKATDQYIVGIDPNQGGNASCGIVVIKISTIKHVVNVLELKRLTTQNSTQILQKLCDDYNVMRIFMDSRGGGNALRDLLEEGYGGVEPIIDRTNPEHKHVEGRHILEMVDFNPKWIANANFTTKALLEDKKLLFPEPPQTISDLEGKLYENINILKSQMLNIVVTQTGVGNLHFDTPRKGQNKDLYSAMILAAHGAREFEKEFEEDVVVLYNSGGLIRERKPGATFNPIVREGSVLNRTGIESAILKGKRRIK
jgi:intein/homing endonuclease